MNFILQPWQLLFAFLSDWVSQRQRQIIEFQNSEILSLMQSQGQKRLRLAAIDFTTIEVWTRSGLVTFYLLFVMQLKTRRVQFAGCTPHPTECWMQQIARNLTDSCDGFLLGKRYVLMDRDGKFCPAFRKILKDAGAEPLLLPSRSPNLNAYVERFMKSIKSESLARLIFFGEQSLRRAVTAFLEHYHGERNHQGLDNQILEPDDEVGSVAGQIECRERLGGLLRYYYRDVV